MTIENLEDLLARGRAAHDANDLAAGRVVFLMAVRRAAEENNRPAMAEALCGLGQAEHGIGSLEAARHHYANAAQLYRKDGPAERLAYALREEATILREDGKPEEAETLEKEADQVNQQT